MANFRTLPQWLMCVFTIFLFGVWAACAQASSEDMVSQASDPTVETEKLELFVVPLTVAQISELADVWQGHLSDVISEFVELSQKDDGGDSDAAKAARAQVEATLEQQTRVADNYRAVIASWTAKGGKAEEIDPHQRYLTVVAGATIRATNPATLFSIAWDWLGSRDGGLGFLMKTSVFFVSLIVLLFVARFVRNLAARGLRRLPAMSNLLRGFVLTVVYWITVVVGLMIALGIAGVNVTPLFAVFGGLSFILGFALQDTLGNLASGLMIMVLKPFDTGDFIEVSGASGVVDDMSVVSTQIRTFDNQIIVVPNSKIWGDVITNVSAAKTRRVDLVFGIAYSDSAPEALEVLKGLVAADKRCLPDPAPAIFVGELGESSVNLFCRPWVRTEDYWDVYWDLTGLVKETFDAEGISIPFPQRDVHLIQADG
ncbi:small conductance mechanosensitive channel [Shimia isoporae]|uniref:Small-conductance mechanosensitive channel n=1 Tax=Shimia isoporae TaxID=647720 RepID=A0A4R1NKR6_9RHOB|nr:mechanosensitive ion channel family protein [Shimia isoporae]TCL08685.1 small conductance mechanosensitive channel [Shimia isoporae]